VRTPGGATLGLGTDDVGNAAACGLVGAVEPVGAVELVGAVEPAGGDEAGTPSVGRTGAAAAAAGEAGDLRPG
jgi:hypothetical protein